MALVAPPAIFTEARTVAAFTLELLSVTVTPAVGAGPLRVTVPATLVDVPPITLVGFKVTPESAEG